MLARLVERADVLMENFRVGVLDRLGFPVARLHELNPGLVVLSITGFGHDGPEAKRAGYDQIAQGEGGLMSITGTEQPTKVGVPIADLLAGMNGAFGVLAALHERTRTGRGRVVRTSLLAGMVGVHAFQGTRWTVAGEVPGPGRRPPPGDRAVRHVRDRHRPDADRLRLRGPVARAVHGVRAGRRRGAVRHQPAAGRAPRRAGRADRGATSPTEPAEHWLGAARRRRGAVGQGAHRSTTSTAGSRRARRGCCCRSSTPTQGRLELPGSPIRFDDNAFSGGRSEHVAPPTLGQHDASIREWLDGLDS